MRSRNFQSYSVSRLPAFLLTWRGLSWVIHRAAGAGYTAARPPKSKRTDTTTTQLLQTWLLCNLCIPVACDKLCQHITLVRRFSCIIHPGAYIPHGHFQIPLKLIPLFVINSLARFSCVAALWLSVSSVSEGVTCPKQFRCTVPRRPRDLHLIIHRAENKASWVVWCVFFFFYIRGKIQGQLNMFYTVHTHKRTHSDKVTCTACSWIKKRKPWKCIEGKSKVYMQLYY